MQTDEDYNDDTLRYIRKIKRRNRYEKKKEIESGIVYVGSEDDFSFSNAVYLQWQESENQKKSYQALYEALEDLKIIDPAGHKLIIEYYFAGERVTYTELGKKYGISRQACTKKIRKCLSTLKSLVELHKYKS